MVRRVQSGHDAARIEVTDEDRLRIVRFAQPAFARRLWRQPDSNAEFRSPRRTQPAVRPALCRQPALHAGAPRHDDRPAVVPASKLGAARAVRQCLSRNCCIDAGIYSHLVTDHYHYWEDGGATYHNRYDSYEFVRGQEGDRWKAMVQPQWERLRELYHARQFSTEHRNRRAQDVINREFIRDEKDFPSVQCFAHAFDFLDRNRDADGWLLQLETFDPHEPFYAPARFKQPFDTGWTGPIRDWPRYGRVDELPEECEELRANYYAVSRSAISCSGSCWITSIAHDLWRDTALIVTTDHGFLLGEHDFWAKNRMNLYEEIVHIPLFAHDPRHPSPGTRTSALTQSIDLAPSFLDLFGVAPAAEMQGRSILGSAAIRRRTAARRRAVRLFRRRGQRDRWAPQLSSLSARPANAGDLPVYADADAHRRRGSRPRNSRRPASARRCRSPRAPNC